MYNIQRDYLGIPGDATTPLYASSFKKMFRISRTRFQVMMEDIMAKNIKFYQKNNRTIQASLEAKLLLPLKSLAYGVPPHAFMDYFQMSAQYARDCCKQFHKAIKLVYMDEYLRLPTPSDLKAITKAHKAIHGVDGLMGSLDCTHTYWKNCPKAWQGSYKGKEEGPSIAMEALCDYHMFFWHVSYGYPGNFNDLNILALSPLLDRMIDGSFHELEEKAGVVPYRIDEHEFTKTFILVDGIYPPYCRFVKGITNPSTKQKKKYTAWQEAVRKDIERAFGVLKGTWQFLARPIMGMNMEDIHAKVTCCIILHNILVSDRVMGDCRATYKPDHVLEEEEVTVQQPYDLREVQATYDLRTPTRATTTTTAAVNSSLPASVEQLMTRTERFKDLQDKDEYVRLHTALMSKFGGRWSQTSKAPPNSLPDTSPDGEDAVASTSVGTPPGTAELESSTPGGGGI